MNWVFLIVAGLFEVGFAFCLGKAKETSGTEMYLGLAEKVSGMLDSRRTNKDVCLYFE
ncbi:hypothetical protein [Algoriphagus sp. NG3]|uniref:hypothetical protein n=1 Tax=Algoriphagus sp. NG3 TaxID=3097546 RepID=UPI0039C72F28